MSGPNRSIEVLSGCFAVPVEADRDGAILTLCVVVRKREGDPPAPVLLRGHLDAKVYLGCVIDAGGHVQRWVECWVQDSSGLGKAQAPYRRWVSNTVLDERWAQSVQGFEALDEAAMIRTGFELRTPAATFLDMNRHAAVVLSDSATKKHWRLCTDDAILQAQGLDPYSKTLARYLHLSGESNPPRFVQVYPPEPVTPPAISFDELRKNMTDVVSFNPGCGRLLVRDYLPVDYESFVDALADGPIASPTSEEDPSGQWTLIARTLEDRSPEGRLLAWHQGQSGRIAESLHLRLHLLTDAIKQVRGWVERTQRPMLNLHSGSFGIRVGNPGAGLPMLWTCRAVLQVPGDALKTRVPDSQFEYFLPTGLIPSAVYSPSNSFNSTGSGTLRITEVRAGDNGATILQLKLITQERIDTSDASLLWLRFNIGEARLDLYAMPQADPSLAAGEYRLRTVEQAFSPQLLQLLNTQSGVLIRNASFEMVPLLNTPCDLYAMGVLAIRTLLVNARLSLPEALDRIVSLSQHLAQRLESAEDSATVEDIAAIFAEEKRWFDWLGAQHLSSQSLTSTDAFDVIPTKLWYGVLLALLRMLSGLSVVSECRSLAAADAGAIHRVFDQSIDRLSTLMQLTRSLLIVDWHVNREVNRVIRGAMRGSGSSGK